MEILSPGFRKLLPIEAWNGLQNIPSRLVQAQDPVTHIVYHDEVKYPLKRKVGRNPMDQSPIPSFHSIFTRNHSIIRRSLLKIRTYLHTTCLN
jgi:hypothetical protein